MNKLDKQTAIPETTCVANSSVDPTVRLVEILVRRVYSEPLPEEIRILLEDMKSKPDSKVKRFVPPTVKQVFEVMRKYPIAYPQSEAQKFMDYFESVDWIVGGSKKKMKSWEAAVRTWVSKLPKHNTLNI